MLFSPLTGFVAFASAISALTINVPTTNVSATATKSSFDPTVCKLAESEITNWEGTHYAESPPPDPDSDSTLSSPANGTNKAIQIATNKRPRPSDTPETEFCIQHRQLKFKKDFAWLRLRPILIDDEDRDYYFVCEADAPVRIRVWASNGLNTSRWTLVLDRWLKNLVDNVHLKGYLYVNKEVMVDLELSPGTGGLGATGEIALFSANTFPKPDSGNRNSIEAL